MISILSRQARKACIFGFGLLLFFCQQAFAQPALPESVSSALKKAKISENDIAIVVADADSKGKVWLLHNEKTAMNPASVIKLVTTFAALDILGPNYIWKTAIFADGELDNKGVLHGSLYIRGSGDPSMTADRMRDLLLQVRASGITQIQGNVVIDRSAYQIPEVNPGAFDGEPLRAYNVKPDALLINYKTVELIFNAALAQAGDQIPVLSNPPLTGVKISPTVTVGSQKNCADWRANLKADFNDTLNIRFDGSYPVSCGSKRWYVAYPDPLSYSLRVVGGLWEELGGSIKGRVTFGPVPANAKLIAEGDSKTLGQIVYDINKFSNNVMAQSAFLALSLPDQKAILSARPLPGAASWEGSQRAVQSWWAQRIAGQAAPVMENGSGLSRKESISALSLAVMMQHAWQSAVMPEYLSSLPIAGVDGTMRRCKAEADAHIKTGSLNNVTARAGYVLGKNGKRRVLVFFVNSDKAAQAREAMDALIDWAAQVQ